MLLQSLKKHALNFFLILILIGVEIYMNFYYLPYDQHNPNVLIYMNWILGICLVFVIVRLLTYKATDYEQTSPIPTFTLIVLLSWLGSDIGRANVSWINSILFVAALLLLLSIYPIRFYLIKNNRFSSS